MGLGLVCRALRESSLRVYYIHVYWNTSISSTDLAVYSSSRAFVCVIAGKRGLGWGALIASGIDNNRQHYNGTSFDVAGLLYLMR